MNCAGCLRIEGRLLKKCWWLSLHRRKDISCRDIGLTGRQRSVWILSEMYWCTGIALPKFFTEEETDMNYTYIVQCADGTLYTGWTNCLARRMKAHNEGKSGAKYTRAKRPVKLVYYEGFATREEAMSREYRIKQLTREKKLELMKF